MWFAFLFNKGVFYLKCESTLLIIDYKCVDYIDHTVGLDKNLKAKTFLISFENLEMQLSPSPISFTIVVQKFVDRVIVAAIFQTYAMSCYALTTS